MGKLLNLPDKFTALRPHQVKAISQIQHEYQQGKRFVFLDAPTGSGKTIIGEYVRQLNNWKAVYTCTTKSLQAQFHMDFPYARVLKGRNNYPTEIMPGVFADECRNQVKANSCSFCPTECKYQTAKELAALSSIAILNVDYLLNVCRIDGGAFGNRDLCIIDECDELENKLMDYVTINLSPRQQVRLGISPPAVKTYTAKGAFECWKDWAGKAIDAVTIYRDRIDKNSNVKSWMALNRLRGNLLKLYNSIGEGEDGKLYTDWIYVYEAKEDNPSITFKPINVKHHAKKTLLDYEDRFLLMSATIIAPEVEADNLGLDPEEYGVVTVDSTFPAKNRPIYPVPAGSMAYKNRTESTPKVIDAIQRIVDKHSQERIIIHTHTAYLAKQISGHLRSRVKRPIFTYENAGERDTALHNYKQTRGSVLVAMSMQRGIDLPGDLCNVQIIALLPRMPMQDQQIQYRMFRTKGGKAWYDLFTIRSLVQQTGRGVRSKDDTAITYVLDSQFLDFHRNNGRMFPKWWNEAVDWSGNVGKEILNGEASKQRV